MPKGIRFYEEYIDKETAEKHKGLYQKYKVEKLNGRPMGEKGCIVLEFDDPIAKEAIITWAKSMRDAGYVQVWKDIAAKLGENK